MVKRRGKEGKGKEGKGKEGKGKEGKVRERKEREIKGREIKGTEGRGMEWKGGKGKGRGRKGKHSFHSLHPSPYLFFSTLPLSSLHLFFAIPLLSLLPSCKSLEIFLLN